MFIFYKLQSIKNTLFFAQFWLKKPQTLVGSIEFLYFYFFKENRRFMENSVSPHQVAEAFYAAFKKLPSVVREEVKTMIETPVRTKKKSMPMTRNILWIIQ